MKGLLVTALLLVVVVLGMVLPRFVIVNGVSQYEGDEEQMAERAMIETGIFFAGSPMEQLSTTAMRVSRVGSCPQYSSDPDSRNFWFSDEVQLYTIFGISYSELLFRCIGTEIIQFPQNTAECPRGQARSVDKPCNPAKLCART